MIMSVFSQTGIYKYVKYRVNDAIYSQSKRERERERERKGERDREIEREKERNTE